MKISMKHEYFVLSLVFLSALATFDVQPSSRPGTERKMGLTRQDVIVKIIPVAYSATYNWSFLLGYKTEIYGGAAGNESCKCWEPFTINVRADSVQDALKRDLGLTVLTPDSKWPRYTSGDDTYLFVPVKFVTGSSVAGRLDEAIPDKLTKIENNYKAMTTLQRRMQSAIYDFVDVNWCKFENFEAPKSSLVGTSRYPIDWYTRDFINTNRADIENMLKPLEKLYK